MPSLGTVTVTEGRLADAGRFDDWGSATATIEGGPHNGHTIIIDTAKNNCGAFYKSVECSCGAEYEWGSGGCSSHHSIPEHGDAGLGRVMTLAYNWIE